MKISSRFLISICIFLLGSSCVVAKEEQELFLQAGVLYNQNKIQEASDLYTSLPIKSAGTLYNLGNCAYQLGDTASALGYWYKALPLAPRFMYPSLLSNIQQAHTDLELPGLTSMQRFLLYVSSYVQLLVLQIVSLTSVFIALFLLCLRRVRWLYTVLLTIVAVLLVSLTGAIYRVWYAPYVVITQPTAQLSTGPDAQFPLVQKIPLGMRVRVVGVQDSWYKISYLKQRGWVQQSHVMNID